MTRLLLRFYRTEHGTPDRVPRLVLPQIERRVEVERFPEFVAALRYAIGGAVNECQVLVSPHAVGGAAQAGVETRLEQFRRVGQLAVLVSSHSELQFLFATVRAEQGATGGNQGGNDKP